MAILEHSPRYLAALTIAVVHAAAIYAVASLAPSIAANQEAQRLSVHFITDVPQHIRRLPAKPQTFVPELNISEPSLLVTEPPLPEAVLTERSPQLIAASVGEPAASGVPKFISTVEYVRQPAPHYPPQSRRLKEQGVVVLRVLIDERGQACDIVIESSSGHARLDHAAREAVANAVFRPYVEDGAPRRALVLIPIEFFIKQAAV